MGNGICSTSCPADGMLVLLARVVQAVLADMHLLLTAEASSLAHEVLDPIIVNVHQGQAGWVSQVEGSWLAAVLEMGHQLWLLLLWLLLPHQHQGVLPSTRWCQAQGSLGFLLGEWGERPHCPSLYVPFFVSLQW